MDKRYIIFGVFIILLGAMYYYVSEDIFSEKQEVFVDRVIDGDTFVLDNGLRCRLKGINAPEEGMFLYEESLIFLNESISSKIVEIEHFGSDVYGRLLVYVFVDGEDINEEMLRNGLAHFYKYENDSDKYYDNLISAEGFARENEFGIWKHSDYYDCIDLIEFDYISEGGERIVLDNLCGEIVDILIKDDATHIFEEVLYEGDNIFEFEKVFNDAGDSLYVWDGENGELIVFERY